MSKPTSCINNKSNYSHPQKVTIDLGNFNVEISQYKIPIKLLMCFGGYVLEEGKLELNTEIAYVALLESGTIEFNHSGSAQGNSKEEALVGIAKVIRIILIKTNKITKDNE